MSSDIREATDRIRIRKRELESYIGDAIKDKIVTFQLETGLAVKDVQVDMVQVGEHECILGLVRVEIDLL